MKLQFRDQATADRRAIQASVQRRRSWNSEARRRRKTKPTSRAIRSRTPSYASVVRGWQIGDGPSLPSPMAFQPPTPSVLQSVDHQATEMERSGALVEGSPSHQTGDLDGSYTAESMFLTQPSDQGVDEHEPLSSSIAQQASQGASCLSQPLSSNAPGGKSMGDAHEFVWASQSAPQLVALPDAPPIGVVSLRQTTTGKPMQPEVFLTPSALPAVRQPSAFPGSNVRTMSRIQVVAGGVV